MSRLENKNFVSREKNIFYPLEEEITYSIFWNRQEIYDLSEKDLSLIRDTINKMLED